MANPNLDKPQGVTFGTMTASEAVAGGLDYCPFEITQMSYDPEDMPKVSFGTLCSSHTVSTVANAEYLVRLWNGTAQIPGQEYCRSIGTDVHGHLAWLLEEDVGKEAFWRMLKQQATPPMQPEQALLTLWEAAKDSRRDSLRQRLVQYYSDERNVFPATRPEECFSPAY
jgi:hypothetical protein